MKVESPHIDALFQVKADEVTHLKIRVAELERALRDALAELEANAYARWGIQPGAHDEQEVTKSIRAILNREQAK